MSTVLIAIFVGITLVVVWNVIKEEHNCRYCGRFASHEESCPYLMLKRDYDDYKS